MSNTSVKELSDKELLEIILRDENSNVPGSLYEKATIEYSTRNKKKEQRNQEQLLKVINEGLEKIIKLLEFIAKKPKLAAFFAVVIAITIGVAINVATEFFLRLLKFR